MEIQLWHLFVAVFMTLNIRSWLIINHPCESASVPFSWFESHYNLTAASLGFEHEQLTNWNVYYRKTEGQNVFATPTTSVQQAWLLVYMLHSFFCSRFLLASKHARRRYLPALEYKELCGHFRGRLVYCACVCVCV